MEVESPFQPSVAPESVIGHVADMVACLLLNVVQSPLARYPLVEPFAAGIETAPATYARGELNVVVAAPYTTPRESTARPVDVIEDSIGALVNVCVPAHVFAVVVPKASEKLFVEY